jgi:hypothetical protein
MWRAREDSNLCALPPEEVGLLDVLRFCILVEKYLELISGRHHFMLPAQRFLVKRAYDFGADLSD